MSHTIPQGFLIGNYNDDFTGVTVVTSLRGFAASVDVRGGAPATRETALLAPSKAMQSVNAIVLSGGSAYGLAASCGVMDYLKTKKIGFAVGEKIVPIVVGASIFDLNDDDYHYPTPEYGYKACDNAFQDESPSFGAKGAGKGATVGKILGRKYASPSGVGIATVKTCGATVTAIIVVNAFGDVVDGNNQIIAGAKDKNGNYADTEELLINYSSRPSLGENTTIGCILTDAALTKLELSKLATVAHNGLARSIRPVHTDYDGDALFAASSGIIKNVDLLPLSAAAVKAVNLAVINAVTE